MLPGPTELLCFEDRAQIAHLLVTTHLKMDDPSEAIKTLIYNVGWEILICVLESDL